jgi:hypothetical protein
MNRNWTRPLLVLLPLLAGCGAGGGGSGAPVPLARTTGVVLSVDSRTTELSRVRVGAPAADRWATCDPQGRFDLGRLPAEMTRFRFEPGDRPAILVDADLRDCSAVDMAVEIVGDGAVRMSIEHCGERHSLETRGEMGGMSRMTAMGDMPGTQAMMGGDHLEGSGTATMHEDDAGHMGLTIVVPGLDSGLGVEVMLVAESGESASLGSHVVSADGVLRVEWTDSMGDPLPFGVSHMHELSGMSLEVHDAVTGELVYSGVLPEAGLLQGGC